jgi:magnesium chelatase subunit I
MKTPHWDLPHTLGPLRRSGFTEERIGRRTVKEELRSNLICKLQKREPLFPGIVGYDDTAIPQIVNALLSRQNFILPLQLSGRCTPPRRRL